MGEVAAMKQVPVAVKSSQTAELGQLFKQYKVHESVAAQFAPLLRMGVKVSDIEAGIKVQVKHGADPAYYIEKALPRLAPCVKTAEQFRITTEMIGDYYEHCGVDNYNASAYLASALPELFKAVKSDEQAGTVKDLVNDYMRSFGQPYGYACHVLPSIMGKTASDERLKAWDAEVKGMAQDYKAQWGKEPAEYMRKQVKEVVTASKALWHLQLGKQLAADELKSNALDVLSYIEDRIPQMLNKIQTDPALSKWKAEAALHIMEFSSKDPGSGTVTFVETVLPKMLAGMKTVEEVKLAYIFMKEYGEHIQSGNYDYSAYQFTALPALLKELKSYEEMEAARGMVEDYMTRFGEPYGYALRFLPQLIKKVGFGPELANWDEAAKKRLGGYLKGSRDGEHAYNYMKNELATALRSAKSPSQLESAGA